MKHRVNYNHVGTFEIAIAVIKAIVGPRIGEKSLLDVCSYEGTITKQLPFRDKVYTDIMDCSDKFTKGENFIRADVIRSEHPIFKQHYDVSTCLDGIEHLHKADGWTMLRRLEKISDIQIIFTPLDPFCIDLKATNPEAHRSLWQPGDLPDWGHVVFSKWHQKYNIGAFFSWNSPTIGADMARVKTAGETF